jgi:ActR/RegA family two-component response regulator
MQRDWESRWANIATALEHDAENIRALARIAEIHERRLGQIEGLPD